MSEKLHWHYCRVCGRLGRIDDDQVAGRVSIQCPYNECDGHYTLIPIPGTVRDMWDITHVSRSKEEAEKHEALP